MAFFYFLKGSGRAFAAGGDIVALYRFIKQGQIYQQFSFVKSI
jgi:enoyl-CoA hydratase/carnithine racemase